MVKIDGWRDRLDQQAFTFDAENLPPIDPPIVRHQPTTGVPGGPLPPASSPFIFKFLISYYYFANIDLDQLVSDMNCPVQIFADCGAFTAFTKSTDDKPITIDIEAYAAWCHKWSHVITTCANLDVIGAPPEATAANQPILESLGVDAIPVFHVYDRGPDGTDYRYLDAYCEQYPYVALGAMVGYQGDLHRFLGECFTRAEKYGTVFHGFGQTSPDILLEYPWYSADSTGWSKGYRFGTMEVWDPDQLTLVDVPLFHEPTITKYADVIRDHGVDPLFFLDREMYHSRYAIALAITAWTRFANYLRDVKSPVHLYAATKPSDLKKAGEMGPAPGPPGPHLYLAGPDMDVRPDSRFSDGLNTARDHAMALHPSVAVPGPHLYLVDASPPNLTIATTHMKEGTT